MQFPFDLSDIFAMGVGYAIVFLLIGLGLVLQKFANTSSSFSRKIIHLGAVFSVYTIRLYTNIWAVNIPTITITIMLFLASPKSPFKGLASIFSSMARVEDYEKGHIMGPIYYAIALTVSVAIFSLVPGLLEYSWIWAIPVTILALGDGLAPLIGTKWGKHKYTVLGSTRSLEGSLAMFLGSIVGYTVAIIWFGGIAYLESLTLLTFVYPMLLIAGIATFIEAITPGGYDNLTIPFILTLMIWMFRIPLGFT